MVSVGSKELKNRLGKYLKLVREGETIQITDRGTPVGQITPVADSAAPIDEQFTKLLASGHVRLGISQPALRRRSFKPVRLKPGPSTTEMIAEDRR